MSKHVIIVGAGEVGSFLAGLLRTWGHQVVLVEENHATVTRLRQQSEAQVFGGDATDPEILQAAGIRGADIVAAVTGSDEVNLTVASLARFEFGVGRTLARVNVPRHAWMFTPEVGVDVALNQAEVLAHLIVEQASTGNMLTLLKLGGGRYSLLEAEIGPNSPAAGHTIASLPLPQECILVGVLRNKDMILPRGATVLQVHDQILALTHGDHVEALRSTLEG
jgi:trk system potassium uptake protein TrkA